VKPYQYQLEGAAHLQGARVRLLADEMGLGKTMQAVLSAQDHGEPVTVLCPAIMCAEWQTEIAQWCQSLRSVSVRVEGRKSAESISQAGYVVCSYDRAARPEVADALRKRRGHLICDEAHYLKTPDTKRTLAVLGLDGSRAIATDASRVSFLTGTPLPNNASEMFPMVKTAGLYDGSHWDFLHEFCHIRNTMHGEKITGYKNPAGLRDLLSGFMLRRTNPVELPPTDYGEMLIEPDAAADPAALAAVSGVDAGTAQHIEKAAAQGNFDLLATPHLSTLRRAVGLAKAHAVAKAACELLTREPDAKIVLFGIHRDVLQILSNGTRDFHPVTIQGGATDKQRREYKDRFQTDPNTRVAVCQIKAAGTGITLTAANYLWLAESSWSPADNEQAFKRIIRIGQKRRTSLQYCSLNNSIDQAVTNVLRRKRSLIDEIMKPG
jgi:SWI/SNF-related matrix-associated actin-dependent regulator 1 of chromatin subfamily A